MRPDAVAHRTASVVAILISGATLGMICSSASAGEQVVDTVSATSRIATFRGVTAWSRPDGARFRLMLRRGNRTEVVPVPTRATPFDVDLGPDSRNRVVAVYSRCRRESRSYNVASRGCDLYRYDLTSKQEVKLRGASRASSSEVNPTIWRSRLVFARYDDSRSAAYGPVARLVSRRAQFERRLAAVGSDLEVENQSIQPEPELTGERLALVWHWVDPACSEPDAKIDPPPATSAWGGRLGEPLRRYDRACAVRSPSAVLSPEWVGSTLNWIRRDSVPGSDPEASLVTKTDSGNSVVPLPAGTLVAAASATQIVTVRRRVAPSPPLFDIVVTTRDR